MRLARLDDEDVDVTAGVPSVFNISLIEYCKFSSIFINFSCFLSLAGLALLEVRDAECEADPVLDDDDEVDADVDDDDASPFS